MDFGGVDVYHWLRLWQKLIIEKGNNHAEIRSNNKYHCYIRFYPCVLYMVAWIDTRLEMAYKRMHFLKGNNNKVTTSTIMLK